MQQPTATPPALKKGLNLPLMVLYGLGTTIGAGIYALIGEIASIAGYFAPLSFLIACALAALTALTFAEFASRFPRAGAAAFYFQQGFGSVHASTIVGVLVVAAGVVSSGALVNAFAAYAMEWVVVDRLWLVLGTVVVLTGIAAWGVQQSVALAGVISVVEIAGLVWIIGVGVPEMSMPAEPLTVGVSGLAVGGVLTGALLAFYAFIGFEDMVDMAEEVKDVRRTMPAAILWTLGITTILYFVLMSVVVFAVTPGELAGMEAPLADFYTRVTSSSSAPIRVIALFAIVNGAMIQLMMASRVLYGLASRDQLPAIFAQVSSRTQTPIFATLVVGAVLLTLALLGGLAGLAHATSTLMLVIFGLVNASLWRVKGRDVERPDGFKVPRWVPLFGAVVCLGFAVGSLLR